MATDAPAQHKRLTHGTHIAPVALVNASTVCDDDELESYVRPLQRQVTEDFAPIWGADARIEFVRKGHQPPKGSWWIAVLDDSDQAGALGYHDLTAEGLPLSKVFAKSDKHYGNSVSVTISHELLEMLGDPGINMTASLGDDQGHMKFFAYEACDACESEEYAYEIDGVLVSDFVYPDWFGGVTGGKYDHMGHIKKPFEILPGGYIGVWTPTTGWTQVTGERAHGPKYASRAPIGSRRERRRVGTARWYRSVPE